jgi:hypothetical protein
MVDSAFVRVTVEKRRRGRPDRDRRIVLDLSNGTRLNFSSESSPEVVLAVVQAVLRVKNPQC